MKLIELTRGLAAMIDDADYEWASRFKWNATKGRGGSYYASRSSSLPPRTRQMQRELMDPERLLPRSVKVDHKSGDTLDNRRDNLRLSTDSQSNANRRGWGRHGFKGIYYDSSDRLIIRRWVSVIKVNGRLIYGKRQMSLRDAAREYNRLAVEHFGEFARLNIIPAGDEENGPNE